MRSSIVLAVVTAVSVLARPQPMRRQAFILTETDVVVETVVVYITEEVAELTTSSIQVSASATKETRPTAITSDSPSPLVYTPLPQEPDPARKASAAAIPQPAAAQEPAPTPTSAPEPQPQSQPPPKTEHEPEPTPAPSEAPASSPEPSPPQVGHPTGADQAYLSAGSDYQAAILYHHNAARANHAAEPLTWDSTCEDNARIAAHNCLFDHYVPEGAFEGQNLFTVSGDAFNVTAGITESWYKGELAPMTPYFGKPNIPDEVFHAVGHLTQMVWKSTTKVGCVSFDCGSSMVVAGASSDMNKYTVCNYSPQGNIGGRYADNVVAPLSSTNLGGWAD